MIDPILAPYYVDAIPPLVLIGAHSRAGRAILRAWPGPAIVQIHRGEGASIKVTNYDMVPSGAIPPGAIVINCVGTSTGSEETLTRLNCIVALGWAQAAAAADAKHFIQLSSFSVYGRTEQIGRDTPERPDTAYGRSKLTADRALLALERPALSVTVVRIPMLFGDATSKLAQLVRLTRVIGGVPAVAPPIERSMLSYDALAAAIVALARSPVRGVVHVADPTVFTYDLLRDGMTRATGHPPRRVRVPAFAIGAARRIAPSLHARLFASSRLDPSAAFAFAVPPEATLEREIERLGKASAR